MKKLFLALLFSTVLFIGLPHFKVSAMPITYDIPFSAVPDFVNMLNTILSGGEINISGITSLEELQAEWNNSLLSTKNFLQRTAQSLFNQMVAAAMAGQESLTNTGADFVYKCLPEDLAYFMSYNIDWYKNANKPIDIELPQPDVDYVSIINEINNPNDAWLYASNPNPTYPNYYLVSPMSVLSICSISENLNLNSRIDYTAFNILTNKITIRIYSLGNDLYTFDCQPNKVEVLHENSGNYNVGRFAENYPNGGIFTNDSRYINPPLFSKTGTLEDVFKYIRANFINVDIYVDGVLWAKPGNIDIPEDFISAPDVISLGDLGLDIYDVFFPGNIEGYGGLSINGFIEWLRQQLGEKDHISLGDLIDDDVPIVITNEGTTGITYDDTRPVPKVIEDEIDIPDDPPDPNTTPTPSPFPLPPFPNFSIPSDIPNSNIQHTVLAEIVDATQSVVPDDLMVLIWSTFGLLVVGGLIYILHK